VREVRAIAVENGRLATDVNFFPMIAPIVGRTMEEAQAKHDRYEKNADWEGGLATISSFMNVDFSKHPVDEPFDVEGLKTRDSAIHSLINSAKNFAETGGKPLTPRMLGHAFAFCGFGQPYVGTPEMIADVFESFVNEANIDGFNVACEFSYTFPFPLTLAPFSSIHRLTRADVSIPESYEDLVELLIPVLMERGIMWKDYAVPGGTFRENLRREKDVKTLSTNHPGARFRYEELKARLGADEFGDITIKRERKESMNGIAKGVAELEVGEAAEAALAKA
jgi:hypothetical protein